jgi:hypothetical protein
MNTDNVSICLLIPKYGSLRTEGGRQMFLCTPRLFDDFSCDVESITAYWSGFLRSKEETVDVAKNISNEYRVLVASILGFLHSP